ncbi:MAG: Rpn family recombination-promoting nuclease/putative transposase, partial [Mariprofundaceae bacterium]|nr:Rpn family recombination-promoting nuclease/putative transposase [Mariprofundaceae bacterium]
MPRKLISFDWAIKRILRSKANFEILEGFLSELLFEDITILEILESESNQEQKDDKFNRLDIKVRNQREEIILIEIQYDREMDYMQRILYASSKAIVEHMKESESYAKVTKIISISILYFDFGNGDDYIYKGTTNFRGLHNKSLLQLNEKQRQLYKTNKVEKLYPEFYLIKIKNFNDHAKDTLDEWINFLKNEEISDHSKAKGLLKAKETLDYLKMEESERLDYNQYQKNLHDQASAYEATYVIGKLEGKKEGVKQEKINIALKSLEQGLELETIKMITGLTDVELKNLINKK